LARVLADAEFKGSKDRLLSVYLAFIQQKIVLTILVLWPKDVCHSMWIFDQADGQFLPTQYIFQHYSIRNVARKAALLGIHYLLFAARHEQEASPPKGNTMR
jgi:hypothetical protein